MNRVDRFRGFEFPLLRQIWLQAGPQTHREARPRRLVSERLSPPESDLRRVITVGITHVDEAIVRVWLGHIRRCLDALPERPPVIDDNDAERRLATAMLLAWKLAEGRRH